MVWCRELSNEDEWGVMAVSNDWWWCRLSGIIDDDHDDAGVWEWSRVSMLVSDTSSLAGLGVKGAFSVIVVVGLAVSVDECLNTFDLAVRLVGLTALKTYGCHMAIVGSVIKVIALKALGHPFAFKAFDDY
ncbi:hypothetical protein TNCV_4694341 [Trichonephila clavipes]|uniref:Uncharacterized protein n=1 Tax=Trichonephila clavipes TaxID=2585209 RepID=A0A8X7BHL4_TRICX|nr:hypothetical protein TNCV_4694341 [Trichonephila clavipes]